MSVEVATTLLTKSPRLPLRPYSCVTALQLESFREWSFEPKVNGWRCVVDAERGRVISRHGTTFAESGHILDIVATTPNLAGLGLLDCEFLGRRTKAGKGSVVVMDVMDSTLSYLERRTLLDGLCEVPLDDIPKNAILRFPAYTQEQARLILEDMREVNERRCEVIWEGFVAKHNASPYPRRYDQNECRFWAKARLLTA